MSHLIFARRGGPPAPILPVPLRRPPPAGFGEPRLAPPARRVQENGPSAQAAPDGSPLVGLAGQGVDRVEGGPRDRDPRDCPPVAAAPFPRTLDQAFGAASRGPPARQRRDPSSGLTHGCGESLVGCPSNPRRTVEAGHRGGGTHRLSAPPQAAHPAVPGSKIPPYRAADWALASSTR